MTTIPTSVFQRFSSERKTPPQVAYPHYFPNAKSTECGCGCKGTCNSHQ